MSMLWLVRYRPKESMSPTEFEEVDQCIRRAVLPALKGVKGVLSARAFHSIHGQIVFAVDLEQTGTLDAVFRTQGLADALVTLSKWLVRAGGAEIMWDIGVGQGETVGGICYAMTFN